MSNNLSSESPLSTSMFPVDDPMKTFTPGMSSALTPHDASPSFTSEHIMSALLFVAPIWKPILVRERPSARSIFPLSASAFTVAGLVLGMSKTVVTPPATAARDSVCMSALWVSPGSLKCTWASMPPAMICLPSRSHTSASGCSLSILKRLKS